MSFPMIRVAIALLSTLQSARSSMPRNQVSICFYDYEAKIAMYKDLGSPTISVNIGGTCVEKALLDLGASVNLLPFSMYQQHGLGELKQTTITLSLADRSIKILKGIVEDVLI